MNIFLLTWNQALSDVFLACDCSNTWKQREESLGDLTRIESIES